MCNANTFLLANTLHVSNWGHAKQLKEWREEQRLRQDEVAKELGMSRGGYANYEAGSAPIPDTRLKKLRDMGFSASAAAGKKEVDASEVLKGRSNVIGSTLAGMPYAGVLPAGEWSDPFESGDTQEVDWSYYRANRWCATVDGLSCYPALQPGDFVIFEQTYAPPHNRIVVAQRKGDHGATIKNLKWNVNEGRHALEPVNPDSDEPTADGWGAVAMLVYVKWTSRFGGEVVVSPKGRRHSRRTDRIATS